MLVADSQKDRMRDAEGRTTARAGRRSAVSVEVYLLLTNQRGRPMMAEAFAVAPC